MKKWLEILSIYLSKAGFLFFLTGHFIWYVVRYTIVGRVLIFLLLLGVAFSYGYKEFAPVSLSADHPTQPLHIPAGASFHQIVDSLEQSNLLSQKTLFLILGRLTGKEKNMRAGIFEIPTGLTTWQLLDYLGKAKTHRIKVTLPEGILASKMASILASKIGIDSTRFDSLVHDSAFAASLVPQARSLEGYLLPETYFFEWKTPEKRIVRFLAEKMLAIFKPDSVQAQLRALNRSMEEIITLASIVEGEALVDSERAVIASLYYNRLRLGWSLQADPTIQFALPGPPRRLLNKDLEYDSPYNTYKYKGLPPGPINNPGKNSVLGTIFPAVTSYLYMVAIGDGRHTFSKTLREHNRAHAKFNQHRREVRRRQRAQEKK